MSKLLKHSAVYVLLGFLPVAINFLLAPVYTSLLAPSEYAIIGIGTLFQTFLTLFLSFSLDGALSRLYFNYPDENSRRRLLSTLLLAVFFLSSVALLILGFFGEQLFSLVFRNAGFRFFDLGIWVFITTFSTVVYVLFLAFFRNQENVKSYFIWSMLFFVVPVLGILSGLVFFKAGATGAIIGRAIGSLATIMILLVGFFGRYGFHFDRFALGKALHYSLPLIPYQLMFAGFSNIDRVILERYFTAHDFGVYNFAAMVSGLVPIFITALSNAINPRIYSELSRDPGSKNVRTFNQLSLIGTTFVVCACTAVVVPAMKLFINPAYDDSYMYAGLLFLAYIPYAHYLVYAIPLFYHGKTRSFPFISFFALVAGVIFNLVFLGSFRIWSVCASLVVIRFVQLAAAWLFARYYKFHALAYIRQRKNIILTVTLTFFYALLLAVHVHFGVLPIEVVNLLPLVLFTAVSAVSYRGEFALVIDQLQVKSFVLKIKRSALGSK